MVYGVFDEKGNHILTFDYGQNTRQRAEESAKRISSPLNYCYARELTIDEYYGRLKEISEGKFNT